IRITKYYPRNTQSQKNHPTDDIKDFFIHIEALPKIKLFKIIRCKSIITKKFNEHIDLPIINGNSSGVEKHLNFGLLKSKYHNIIEVENRLLIKFKSLFICIYVEKDLVIYRHEYIFLLAYPLWQSLREYLCCVSSGTSIF